MSEIMTRMEVYKKYFNSKNLSDDEIIKDFCPSFFCKRAAWEQELCDRGDCERCWNRETLITPVCIHSIID